MKEPETCEKVAASIVLGLAVLVLVLWLLGVPACQREEPLPEADLPRCTCLRGMPPDDYEVTLEVTGADGEPIHWRQNVEWDGWANCYSWLPPTIYDVAVRDADKLDHFYCLQKPERDRDGAWVVVPLINEPFWLLGDHSVRVTMIDVRQLPLDEENRKKKEYGEAYAKARRECERHGEEARL